MNVFKKALIIGAALLTSVDGFSYGRGGLRGDDYSFGDDRLGRFGSQQRIVLRFGGEVMRGRNTIFLKKEIKRQNPGMQLFDLQLESVKLVAKTKAGRGKASLVVGQSESYPEVVQGSPYDFHTEDRYTYDRVHLFNPSMSSHGKWQIKLKGLFKVKKVVVIVKNKNRHKRVNIDVQQVYKGQNTLPLKRMAMRSSYVDLHNFDLVAVELKAKSKRGMGQASLIVGYDESLGQTVGGNPMDFHTDHPSTFDTLRLKNPSYDSFGRWMLSLRGKIKVKNITLILKRK